ncbi:MAG: hypothetical protein ACRYE7_02490 [Janthinobacterium lividum]
MTDIMHEEASPDSGVFVDDGTGVHPTATTYASITVGESLSSYPTEYATPTPASYHLDSTDTEVAAFNTYVGGRTLRFYDGSRIWSEYTPDGTSAGYYTQTEPWVTGFRPRYSWDYTSGLTGNVYEAVVPMMVFMANGVNPNTLYYFFVEIFNDFQAHFGYDPYKYGLDGYPSATWPGMIKVVRSVLGVNQRPIERDLYETWFVRNFGSIKAMAPYVYSINRIATTVGRPTRFANLATPTVVSRGSANLAESDDVTGFLIPDDQPDLTMADVSDEVAALQAAAVAKAVAAQAAADSIAQTQAVNAALAASAITQQQAVAAQAASDAALQAIAVANQKVADATALANAVSAAVAAGSLSQTQAVAAQAAADAAVQATALAAAATSAASAQQSAIASALAAQAATNVTQQAAAVAAQKTADATAQQAAVAAQAASDAMAQSTAVANAIAAQAAKDAVWVARGPKFTNGVVTIGSNYSGVGFASNPSLTGMDYTHVWLQAFVGFQQNGYGSITANSVSTLAAAQVSGTGVIQYSAGPYYGFNNVNLWTTGSATLTWFSGWLRVGSVYQTVGWILNTGTAASPTWNLVTTGYGYTSLAPPVQNGGSPASTTYVLTTSSPQSEILSQMKVSTTSGSAPAFVGFIYDGSVGSYGQVTWISQI